MAETERLVNFVRLTILVTKGLQVLQQNFKSRYVEIFPGEEWTDGPQCGQKLKVALLARGAPVDDLKLIEKGRLQKWDIQKICAVLITICNHQDNPQPQQPMTKRAKNRQLRAIKDVLHLRNRLAHISAELLTHRDFYCLWNKGENSLIVLGGDKDELKRIRDSDNIVAGINFKKIELDEKWVQTDKNKDDGVEKFDKKILALGWVAMGKRYLDGKNSDLQSAHRAVEFFKMAATAGNAEGMFLLGKMYETGKGGLVQSVTQAQQLFHQAASCRPFDTKIFLKNVGVAEAMIAIGEQCHKNLKLSDFQRYSKTADWYTKAIENGDTSNADAAYNLALLYRDERWTNMNEGKAVRHLTNAANCGNVLAMESLAWHNLKIEKPMEAEYWLFRSFQAGNLNSREKFLKFKKIVDQLKPKDNQSSSSNTSHVHCPPPSPSVDSATAKIGRGQNEASSSTSRRDQFGGGSIRTRQDLITRNRPDDDVNRPTLIRHNETGNSDQTASFHGDYSFSRQSQRRLIHSAHHHDVHDYQVESSNCCSCSIL